MPWGLSPRWRLLQQLGEALGGATSREAIAASRLLPDDPFSARARALLEDLYDS